MDNKARPLPRTDSPLPAERGRRQVLNPVPNHQAGQVRHAAASQDLLPRNNNLASGQGRDRVLPPPRGTKAAVGPKHQQGSPGAVQWEALRAPRAAAERLRVRRWGNRHNLDSQDNPDSREPRAARFVRDNLAHRTRSHVRHPGRHPASQDWAAPVELSRG